MSLNSFFNPKSVAVIGVSRNENKLGHVIFKNLKNSFNGKIYGISNSTNSVLDEKMYKNIKDVENHINTAIIVVPAKHTPDVIKNCGEKKVKNIIIITAGFSEIGNTELANEISSLLKKYNIRAIGPNTLGIFDAHTRFDSIFIEKNKLKRPEPGKISFITQSGALGAAILDMASEKGYKFSKFISIGNCLDLNESDFLEFLNNDEKTEIICIYLEGIKNGKKFFEVVSKIKKPIIAIKGGITKEGSKATQSHTGSLAGVAEIYKGIFKQLNIIQVNSLDEMFNTLKIFDKLPKISKNNIQVITNGGGYGILCVDAISENNLNLAEFSDKTKNKLRKHLPETVTISNPLDIVGDADTKRYETALKACIEDENIDIILVSILTQLPKITDDIVDILIKASKQKPLIAITTDRGEITKELEKNNIPTFKFPKNAINALKNYINYYK